MQIQLVLILQSTYHKIEKLQLILSMQHAGPYFHLRALSCFKVEARSENMGLRVAYSVLVAAFLFYGM